MTTMTMTSLFQMTNKLLSVVESTNFQCKAVRLTWQHFSTKMTNELINLTVIR